MIKILRLPGKFVWSDSGYGLQVSEPGKSSRLDFQFPSHAFTGFHCQLKPIVHYAEFEISSFLARYSFINAILARHTIAAAATSRRKTRISAVLSLWNTSQQLE